MSTRTGIIIGIALFFLIGIMAYGWGQAQAQNKEYRNELRAAQDSVKAQLIRAEQAEQGAAQHIRSAEESANQTAKGADQLKSETKRAANERAIVDTAGVDSLRIIILRPMP
jgi:uncharacterized protein HemX